MKSSAIKSQLGRLQKQPHQRGSPGLIGNTKEGSSAEWEHPRFPLLPTGTSRHPSSPAVRVATPALGCQLLMGFPGTLAPKEKPKKCGYVGRQPPAPQRLLPEVPAPSPCCAARRSRGINGIVIQALPTPSHARGGREGCKF